MKTHRFSRIATALVIGLGIATNALAEDTASGITGKILGPKGNPAANTQITIIHEPTGTIRTVTTNESGNYSARGLRVGGPYKVVIDSEVFQDEQYNDIFLQVGKSFRLSAELASQAQEVITITGSSVMGYTNKGSGGSWSAEDIMKAAGGNRDLKDVLRSNPLAVTGTGSDAPLSIAGMNPRYNSFNVDGVRQNDDFGLNSNGYPTQRSPISVDAVEQVSLEATPYSARHGGFSGGQINAVTKSGSNELSGSVFFEKAQDSWAGTPKTPDGDEVELDYDEETWGATLGGALVEDTLFFFLSYDKFESPTQLEWGPQGSSSPNETFATQASYDQVREIAERVYGFDAGIWNQQPIEEDEKILAKLDWNINDDHRASFTYQNTEGNVTRGMTSRDSELKLNTHWYNNFQALESYATHFYSNWTDNFTTEIKVAYKEVKTEAQPVTKDFGDIKVYTDTNDRGYPSNPISFGPDQYRHANQLANDTLSLRFQGEYLLDDHEITFGANYESIDIFNLFAPDSLGRWEFDSIADFENQVASDFDYSNAYTNVADDAAAQFEFATLALFIEDSWYVTDELLITAGLRYETTQMDDAPSSNSNFEERYGFSNSVNLDGLDILLPRLSFEWEAAEDLVVSGGVGRFSGGRPNVWLSNSFSNDGITYVPFNGVSINEEAYLTDVEIGQVAPEVLASMAAGDGNTNVTDPNFEMPSDWRYSLGLDYSFAVPNLGDNWLWSAEFMRIDRENDVLWQDLARSPKLDENGNVVTTADGGRIIYEVIDPLTGESSNRYDLMLTNAQENGRSNIITTSLSSAFENGLSFNMSYTNQDITEGTPGTSSTATSNYQYPITLDRQEAYVGTADYQIEHRFVLNLDYTHQFFDNYNTNFNLFYERRSGRPFSYVLGSFRDSDLGDQSRFNSASAYVPYIPTGADDPNVQLDGITWDELSEWINTAGLSGYAGGYAPKNTSTSKWIDRMDLNISQEIPGFMEDHKGTIYFSIQNVLNLVDSAKGKVLKKEFPNSTLVDFDIDEQGRYVYSEPFRGFDGANWDEFDAKASTWNIKVGLRYSF